MHKKHILFLYSHNPSRLAHLRKINSLRNKFEITLIMDHSHEKNWQRRYVDHLITISMKDVYKDFNEIVNKIQNIKKPDGIVNLSEACVPLHSLLSNYWNLIGPSERVVDIARDKYLMRKLCNELSIPIPNFSIIIDNLEKACNDLEFPIIVKPVIGGGSTLVKRFSSLEDLTTEIGELRELAIDIYRKDSLFEKKLTPEGNIPFIAEEIIGGETQFDTMFPYGVGEISVESIYYNGKTVILAIHDKPIPSNGPYFEEYIWSTPSRIPESLKEKAESYVSRIHEELGEGCYVLHTEFRTFKDDLILLEFGARLGGGPIYRSVLQSTGNDFIEVLIDISCGNTPDIKLNNPKPTITHCLWAPMEGNITAITGESTVVLDPLYREHQIYDDVGEKALRAPKSSRSNGHIVFKNTKFDFVELEKSVVSAIDKFRFIVG
ncbi:ATP-grasp domain-containing protein [Bacillus sp. SM2101]|uniref:ATP-grasp domain-containing protein n=1 Tax=Bacillus sp. SM2101 TaxID=2805366 RepID=UPI001BDE92B1|nr:ATP-grasp domain-containing protein [Bacillus sp. SM2101]